MSQEQILEELKIIIERKEQINGNQYEGKERERYFEGFDDGRAMMRIDLLELVRKIKTKEL